MKKIFALVLAMMLVLGMVSAMAATVTVSNAGAGKTYHFYKAPFTVTHDSTDDSIVATLYTKTGESDAFYAAITSTTSDPASPFTVQATADANVFNISASDANAVRAWMAANTALLIDKGTTTPLTNADEGFYLMTVSYVDSTTNETVTENATTFLVKGSDITIIDKNQTTTKPDKQESVDGGTTWKYVGMDFDEATVPNQEIGGTVNYKVVGSFPMYKGTDLVKSISFVDHMSKGLTFDGTSSVTLKINGNVVNPEVLTATTDETTKVTTLTVKKSTVNDSGVFLYNAENTYELTYTAKINEDAITNTDETEENEVEFLYSLDGTTDISAGKDDTKVKSYDADIVKVDGENNLLNGATFKVFNSAGTAMKFVKVSDGVYRLAKTSDESGAVEELAPNGAKLTIRGLKNGTYSVDEVQVPSGYNRLVSAQSFTINNTNLAATISSNKWTEGGVKVVNQKGTVLPSTGGIGTTIFYIAGSILVLAAAILLITKRRMGNND